VARPLPAGTKYETDGLAQYPQSMTEEQQDPRGDEDKAPDREQATDQPVTNGAEEVHQDRATIGSIWGKRIFDRTFRSRIAELTGLRITPPVTLRRFWQTPVAIETAIGARLAASNVLRDAFRPAIAPHVSRVLRRKPADYPRARNPLGRAASCRCPTELDVRKRLADAERNR